MLVFVAQVKESLLIMMQHNMVKAAMPTEREMRRARASGNSRTANVRLHYSVSRETSETWHRRCDVDE